MRRVVSGPLGIGYGRIGDGHNGHWLVKGWTQRLPQSCSKIRGYTIWGAIQATDAESVRDFQAGRRNNTLTESTKKNWPERA